MASGKILIVDDSELVLARVKSRLQREGYEVTSSAHAATAGRYLKDCDLVLLDFHMPGVSGGEALRTLRQAGQVAGIYPAYFVYTSDKMISLKHREFGFDGALINKGDDESLVHQLAVALRLTKLNILRKLSSPPRVEQARKARDPEPRR